MFGIKRNANRVLSLLVILALVLSSTVIGFAMDNTPKPVKSGIVRVYGQTRYDTAIKVADALKSELSVSKFDNVIVAQGGAFPDALSGTYLGSEKSAPILLVSKGNNSAVYNWIKTNLKPGGTIYILGGPVAVPTTVENTLKAFGNTVRLAGQDRYGTNLAILESGKFF